MHIENLYREFAESSKEEIITPFLTGRQFRLERIVSTGQATPEGKWYDQDWSEWVILLQGSAGLKFEHESDIIELFGGDHLNIPAHCKHRVEWTDKKQTTIWLALHYEEERP
ncbi:cupin [Deltaproteobacteria bacterium TL4]